MTDYLKNLTLGFISGLLIALICFGLLPVSFALNGTTLGFICLVLGVAAATLLDRKIIWRPKNKFRFKALLFILLAALCFFLMSSHVFWGLSSILPSNILGVLIAFACGLAVFFACGEMLPQSKEFVKGGFSTFGAVLGFLAGVLLLMQF